MFVFNVECVWSLSSHPWNEVMLAHWEAWTHKEPKRSAFSSGLPPQSSALCPLYIWHGRSEASGLRWVFSLPLLLPLPFPSLFPLFLPLAAAFSHFNLHQTPNFFFFFFCLPFGFLSFLVGENFLLGLKKKKWVLSKGLASALLKLCQCWICQC